MKRERVIIGQNLDNRTLFKNALREPKMKKILEVWHKRNSHYEYNAEDNYDYTTIRGVKFIDSGSFRSVYTFSPYFVLKIGSADSNRLEHDEYRRNPSHKAYCCIVPNTNDEILLMERVRHTQHFEDAYWNYDAGHMDDDRDYKKYPKWLNNIIDRWQVGYNRDGELVEYDYGGTNH